MGVEMENDNFKQSKIMNLKLEEKGKRKETFNKKSLIILGCFWIFVEKNLDILTG